MVKRIIVNGARGKMGLLACETLQQHEQFTVVAQLTRSDNLAQAIIETKADIVLELTTAECVFKNSITILQSGAFPVIGATGLLAEQINQLTNLCEEKQLGGIIVPNFSLGAVLMMQCASKVAAYLPDVEIIEAHHPQKQDAPSGTALKTADMVVTARKRLPHTVQTKELLTGARGAAYQAIPIHSVRLPGVLAQQQVIFGNSGETLTITHSTTDRSCYMPGVVMACEQVMALKGLVYGLEHLL